MAEMETSVATNEPPPFSQPLYPNLYVWFVLASAIDVFLTFVVLSLGGREVNAIARWVLDEFGVLGMTIFKFAIVVLIILICQTIGRHRKRTGRRLAEWAVAITFIPVTFSLVLLLTHRYL